jgi:hypothetical protein
LFSEINWRLIKNTPAFSLYSVEVMTLKSLIVVFYKCVCVVFCFLGVFFFLTWYSWNVRFCITNTEFSNKIQIQCDSFVYILHSLARICVKMLPEIFDRFFQNSNFWKSDIFHLYYVSSMYIKKLMMFPCYMNWNSSICHVLSFIFKSLITVTKHHIINRVSFAFHCTHVYVFFFFYNSPQDAYM